MTQATLEQETTFDLSELSADDAVGLYLKEAACVPLLSAEQELDLADRMCEGRDAKRRLQKDGLDPEKRRQLERTIEETRPAREHLIVANTRLVISVAKRYRGRGLSFLDLIQEGNLGLIKALEKYDPARGYRLSTYATWWIRQTITRAVADQGRTIRIPVHMSAKISQLYKTARRLEQEYDRRPTPEEIAQEMGLKPQRVRWMLKISRYPLSLERPVGEEQDERARRLYRGREHTRAARARKPALAARQIGKSLGDPHSTRSADLAPAFWPAGWKKLHPRRDWTKVWPHARAHSPDRAQGVAPTAPPASQPPAAWVPGLSLFWPFPGLSERLMARIARAGVPWSSACRC